MGGCSSSSDPDDCPDYSAYPLCDDDSGECVYRQCFTTAECIELNNNTNYVCDTSDFKAYRCAENCYTSPYGRCDSGYYCDESSGICYVKSNDDETIEWWVWVLIALGVLCALCVLCYFCFRKSTKPRKAVSETAGSNV